MIRSVRQTITIEEAIREELICAGLDAERVAALSMALSRRLVGGGDGSLPDLGNYSCIAEFHFHSQREWGG
jgi:hypothetical protein